MTAPAARMSDLLAAHRLHASMNYCLGCDWRPTADAGSLADQHEAHRVAVLIEAGVGFIADAGPDLIEAIARVTPCACSAQRDRADRAEAALAQTEQERATLIKAHQKAVRFADQNYANWQQAAAEVAVAEQRGAQAAEALDDLRNQVRSLVDEATGYSVPYRRSRFAPIDSAFTNALRAVLPADTDTTREGTDA